MSQRITKSRITETVARSFSELRALEKQVDTWKDDKGQDYWIAIGKIQAYRVMVQNFRPIVLASLYSEEWEMD